MIRDFLHIFGMHHFVTAIHHKDGAALNAQFLNQCPVVGAERTILVIGEHLHVVHLEIVAPALLRERQIHADSDDAEVGELAGFFIEALGLRVANWRIE